MRLIELADGVLAKVADAITPQPVLAVAAMPDTRLDRVPADGFVLVLHDVRDPGNLGTAVRAADASGAACVVVAGESVDVFNPKALRATAGSVFHLPSASPRSSREAVDALARHGAPGARRGRGAEASPCGTPRSTSLSAVVVGGEATGLSEADRALLDGEVTIEMAGRAESLNVGVAAALVCFEAMRRRADRVGPAGPTPTIERT